MKLQNPCYNKEKLHTKRPLVVLTGPTAVGKTALSIAFAKAIHIRGLDAGLQGDGHRLRKDQEGRDGRRSASPVRHSGAGRAV